MYIYIYYIYIYIYIYMYIYYYQENKEKKRKNETTYFTWGSCRKSVKLKVKKVVLFFLFMIIYMVKFINY